MQVQHDRARPASRAAASARQPNAGLTLWAWTTRAPVRRTAARDVVGREAAAQQRRAAAARATQRGRVALEQLDVLAELLAHQPAQVLDRPLLAAGGPVAVVQEEDHGASCSDGAASVATQRRA